MSYDVVVLGSINLDVKTLVTKFPDHGHTASAQSIEMLPGGKGSNQAVAVSKLGGEVAFVGAVGQDGAGQQMLQNLEKNGVETEFIKRTSSEGTGTFIVMLDETGENTMVGTLGANDTLTKEDIDYAMDKVEAPVFLLQMETSKDSITAALEKAKQKDMFIILDPAPADGYFEAALQYADCVTPNQQETEKITGIKVDSVEDALKAAEIITEKGAKSVVIKMGAHGNLVYQNGETEFIESHKVQAVDTVGAGDTFAAGLAVHYAKNKNLVEAVKFANKAAAIKVSRMGGQDAIPTVEELDQKI